MEQNRAPFLLEEGEKAMSIITPESKIGALGLSEHTRRCLREANIVYVEELLSRAGADLRVHCDEQAMKEIERVLSRAGLHIGEDLGNS